MTELAYTYSTAARIMQADGFSNAEIALFLMKNQNSSGYIRGSKIPTKKEKVAKKMKFSLT